MPKIKWAGVVQNTADYQSGILPATAIKLEMPDTMGEMMLKAIPFLIPSVVIIVFSVFFNIVRRATCNRSALCHIRIFVELFRWITGT